MVQFTHIPDYWKNHSFDYTDLFDKVISLLFNMLSRFVIAFFPRCKCLLISWLQSPSTVILELKKIKYVTTYTFSLSICHDMMGPDSMILVHFESWGPSQVFHSPLSPSSRGYLVPFYLLPLEWYHLQIWWLIFLLVILIPAYDSSWSA